MSAMRQLTPHEVANTSPCAACDGLGYLLAAPFAPFTDQWQPPEPMPVTCRRCRGSGIERS
jgi:hypothetical protein